MGHGGLEWRFDEGCEGARSGYGCGWMDADYVLCLVLTSRKYGVATVW